MSAYAQEKLRLPLVRKVFRQGEKYICGLCKTDYHDYGTANSCMNQCWFDIHHFYPVVKRKRSAKAWVFRCLFCCRDYTDEVVAYNCAQRCVGIKNTAQLREQLLSELPLPPPSRSVSRLLVMTKIEAPQERAKPTPAPKAIKGHEPTPATIGPALEGPSAVPPITLSDASALDLEVEVKIFRGMHKDSYTKQVDLKGEKFQCEYCHDTHVKKGAAQSCFENHFNKDGFEKVVSIDPNA